MVTHEWMVKPMGQSEWDLRQGMLVWLAEDFSALGTGLYLAALFLQPVTTDNRFLGGNLRLDRDCSV
jgi:hypothetical protein